MNRLVPEGGPRLAREDRVNYLRSYFGCASEPSSLSK
jgi:hypothetical protein